MKLLKEHIEYFLAQGALSPGTILKIFTDLNFNKRDVQTIIHSGFDRGYWHLDKNMYVSLGPWIGEVND
jgi:hypothetical protein